jgi:hypothetical protein
VKERGQSKVGRRLSQFVAAMLVFIGTAVVGRAQARADCETPQPPAVGIGVGRSSPYFDLAREAADAGVSGSILVRGGVELTARGDLPIAGPWRARVEGSATNWRVERETYSPELHYQLIASDTVGHVQVRQLVALVGRQGGRTPVCGYVLAGGGIYTLNYKGASIHRPGLALTAGFDLPAGRRAAVQMDLQLHVINTRDGYPVSSTAVLAASLSAAWAYRF